MKPFTGDLFKGLLAFFLLDMGLLTALAECQNDSARRNTGLACC